MNLNLHELPAINACLNAASTVLLLMGWVFIQQGKKTAHRNCMISAFFVSCVFLVLYLVHKYVVLKGVHTPFAGPKALAPVYYAMLLSHIVLAMLVPVLALITISRAFKQRFEAHKKIARWTWPIWMYVSVTGVLIYLLLYQIYPAR
jgi:uncharacterized membrane protein YozB (DUF420 family)